MLLDKKRLVSMESDNRALHNNLADKVSNKLTDKTIYNGPQLPSAGKEVQWRHYIKIDNHMVNTQESYKLHLIMRLIILVKLS